jgi:protein-S-isoprenylcysteine O-methyltransferase Ste14
MLWHFAQWSEATALGTAIRNSQYAFPIIEFFHLAALAVIGGAVLVVDMRLLGLGLQKTSVAELARDAQPWMIGSLIVMLVTGISLYTSEATKCYGSAAFWIKMISLVLAIIFTFTVRRKVTRDDERHVLPWTSKSVGLVSVGLWFAVAWGGRWIGFGG